MTANGVTCEDLRGLADFVQFEPATWATDRRGRPIGWCLPILLSAALYRPSLACSICCTCYAPLELVTFGKATALSLSRVSPTVTRGHIQLINSTRLTRPRGSLYEHQAVQE